MVRSFVVASSELVELQSSHVAPLGSAGPQPHATTSDPSIQAALLLLFMETSSDRRACAVRPRGTRPSAPPRITSGADRLDEVLWTPDARAAPQSKHEPATGQAKCGAESAAAVASGNGLISDKNAASGRSPALSCV